MEALYTLEELLSSSESDPDELEVESGEFDLRLERCCTLCLTSERSCGCTVLVFSLGVGEGLTLGDEARERVLLLLLGDSRAASGSRR